MGSSTHGTENRLRPLENPRAVLGIDISPMPVRHGQTPALCLHLPESEPLWRDGRGFVVRDWRSGVSAERRHLKKSGNVCGGLPTRRYGAGTSSAVP
jgi:hypothetical protein